MERTAVVVNPASGSGQGHRAWSQLTRLRPSLRDAHIVAEHDPDSARRVLAELLHGEIDRVVAVGGDGTANFTINTLLLSGRSDTVAFGLVPAGTGSDFARTLKMPNKLEQAMDRILGATPQLIDVLSLHTDSGKQRYSLNIASAGMSGTVAAAVNAKSRRGRFEYLWSTIDALRRYRPVSCLVELDDRPFYNGKFFLMVVANGQFFGKGMHVAPHARIDDGLADVVIIPPLPLWQLPLRLSQFLRGRHLNLTQVKQGRGTKIRLQPSAGLPALELDGETLPAEAVTYVLHPKALKLLS